MCLNRLFLTYVMHEVNGTTQTKTARQVTEDLISLTLRAAKTDRTILEIFNLPKHFQKKYLKEKC